MWRLGLTVALCALVSLGSTGPMNMSAHHYVATASAGEGHEAPCYYENMHCKDSGRTWCPKCDDYGCFEPKQCSTTACWCVDAKTGKVVANTKTVAMETMDCKELPPDMMNKYCPKDWHHYQGRCFMFVEYPKTWSEAEKYCQFYYSNLASVHSYEEYHLLQLMTVGDDHELHDAWLGAHDTMRPGFWMWSDGTRFYQEYWCREDQAEKPGSCLRMNYGFDKKWAAGNCSEALPFFCSLWSSDYMMEKSM